MAGHATLQGPVALFAPANVIHVVAMATWLGGLVGLILIGSSSPGLIVAVLHRFSPVALACVLVLIVTGVIQALIEFSAWSQFVDTGYGRAVLVKSCGLAVLIGLGALQRRRTIPAATAATAAAQAGASSEPDGAHRAVSPRGLLRRAVGAELATLVVVLAAVGSLAESAPAKETSPGGTPNRYSQQNMGAMPGMAMSNGNTGPATLTTTLGPTELKLVVSPGQVGQNTITLTLTDAITGQPFTGTKQLTLTASLPREQIGPLNLAMRRTAPGVFDAKAAVLGAPGRWTLQITDRTSEFEEAQKSVSVQIQ